MSGVSLFTRGYVCECDDFIHPSPDSIMPFVKLTAIWPGGPLADGLPSNTAVNVDLPRGSDATFDVTLLDQDGLPVVLDLAGVDRLDLNVRPTLDADVVLFKAATQTSEAGRYRMTLTSSDSIDLYQARYAYDLWCTRSGVQEQVVYPGYLSITPRMRR